eukprot:scaffold44673_cov229-Amphora_coffeaeformis.AAC.2
MMRVINPTTDKCKEYYVLIGLFGLCVRRRNCRVYVITHSSSIFVYMGSSIYSHIDNPVQDYSPNKKS